ncbi:Lipoate-protein ligase LplJ [uncultured delta proteobacterium]|uniref:lipoate--protein ligase n=1 Tax=uncultured delta proteobacterium TaxID=34034 RepID=A0A212KCU0_9DELT|nr:Lipoate-protein ligase LplJ [uncultured delta proteobacterium]
MMYYIESDATDPHYNLALEQHVFDTLSKEHSIFMLWRNDNAIIVGKHQNTVAEINASYVQEKGIRVVRRLSGGGAVYHDLGNVNFTFIVAAGNMAAFDFASFCRPVVKALGELGVTAEINGRNDMTIDGKKFSGNAQYCKRGRVMHHGTILYDSDLSVVGAALVVPKDKIESKGLKSVQSRVTNVKAYMRDDIPVERFMEALRDAMFRENAMVPYTLTEEDKAAVATLKKEVYDTWDWNYGASPAYSIKKERRVEGCGKIEVHMDVDKGIIRDIAFFGDYFGNADASALAPVLAGRRVERAELAAALAAVTIGDYFHNLDMDAFLDILTQ